jgi:hypothetical protein
MTAPLSEKQRYIALFLLASDLDVSKELLGRGARVLDSGEFRNDHGESAFKQRNYPELYNKSAYV